MQAVLEEQATGPGGLSFLNGTPTPCARLFPCGSNASRADHKHRTLVVGEPSYPLARTRRQGTADQDFQKTGCDTRNSHAIEGTQSELVPGAWIAAGRAYRGLAKAKLQNYYYFIGAACNVKRWLPTRRRGKSSNPWRSRPARGARSGYWF